jgi:hypothetical protein
LSEAVSAQRRSGTRSGIDGARAWMHAIAVAGFANDAWKAPL